jgi:hypothetical protein
MLDPFKKKKKHVRWMYFKATWIFLIRKQKKFFMLSKINKIINQIELLILIK